MSSRVHGRWSGSVGLHGTAAALYLAQLGVAPPYSQALRYHPYAFNRQLRCRLPAMLAAVTCLETPSEVEALAIEYFDPVTGGALRGCGSLFGVSRNGVVVFDEFTDAVVLSHHIDDAIGAGVLLGLPATATLNADRMHRLVLPQAVRRVVLALNPGGKRLHAQNLAAHLEAEGVSVTVAEPPDGAKDWATAARERVRNG
ncbi:MAG: toprim domain-containing protein [Hyphomonadaceae bacterium]|nr:toprim domain-containing protein [Hyphomonadaceae bacterium]